MYYYTLHTVAIAKLEWGHGNWENEVWDQIKAQLIRTVIICVVRIKKCWCCTTCGHHGGYSKGLGL